MKKIPLTGKHGIGKFALVDDEDYQWVSKKKWYLSDVGYARNWISLLHRIINKTPEGLMTDHINRDKLDNRKSNLRNITKFENPINRSMSKNNTSGFIGIIWDKRSKKWESRLVHKKYVYQLGSFADPLEAALVRDTAALYFHGEFVALNGSA